MACRSSNYITRNASHFKVVSPMFPETEVNEQDDVDEISEAGKQNTSESDISNGSVSNQGASSMGQSMTNGPRCSQCSRRPVKCFGQDIT